jgi:hypothetical protein
MKAMFIDYGNLGASLINLGLYIGFGNSLNLLCACASAIAQLYFSYQDDQRNKGLL